MIKVVIEFKLNGDIKGFSVSGHSGYAHSGQDIVCSAISALSQTTICALDELTSLPIEYRINEEKATMSCVIQRNEHVSGDSEDKNNIIAQSLLKMFVIGCRKIKESYGNRYIKITELSTDK